MVEIATCFFCGRRSANENRFCCIVPTEVEKRAVVRIGGPQKVGDGPSLAARGLLTIVSLKYWHSQLMAVYSDRVSVRGE